MQYFSKQQCVPVARLHQHRLWLSGQSSPETVPQAVTDTNETPTMKARHRDRGGRCIGAYHQRHVDRVPGCQQTTNILYPDVDLDTLRSSGHKDLFLNLATEECNGCLNYCEKVIDKIPLINAQPKIPQAAFNNCAGDSIGGYYTCNDCLSRWANNVKCERRTIKRTKPSYSKLKQCVCTPQEFSNCCDKAKEQSPGTTRAVPGLSLLGLFYVLPVLFWSFTKEFLLPFTSHDLIWDFKVKRRSMVSGGRACLNFDPCAVRVDYHFAKVAIILLWLVAPSSGQFVMSKEPTFSSGLSGAIDNNLDNNPIVGSDDPFYDIWDFSAPYPVGKGIKIGETGDREEQKPSTSVSNDLDTNSDDIQPYDIEETDGEIRHTGYMDRKQKGVGDPEDAGRISDTIDDSRQEQGNFEATGEESDWTSSDGEEDQSQAGHSHTEYNNNLDGAARLQEVNSNKLVDENDETMDEDEFYQRVHLNQVSRDPFTNDDLETERQALSSTNVAEIVPARSADLPRESKLRQSPQYLEHRELNAVTLHNNGSSKGAEHRRWQALTRDYFGNSESSSRYRGNLSTELVQEEARWNFSKPIIYIAGLFPWSENIPAGAVGRGVLPAVHIALAHVNNDSRTDRKYVLEMAYNDTRCDMAVATRAFFDMMAESQTTTAMLFGDACYNVTGPMVQIAHQWDMFQLSYGDTNPMLSDRDEYPNFYRTVPSDSDFNPARLALLRAFNWSTVGTLFQDAKLGEGRHGYAHNRFDTLMTKQKINVSMVQSFSDDPATAVGQLKEHDIRVIVGNFDQDMARRVFCNARQHGMYGPKYQWLILGTYDLDWWRQPDSSIACTPEELNQTLHGYLATDVLTLSTSDEVTESGKTPSEYLELYDAARGEEFSKYHGYAYDGVWVVAKALDRLLDDVTVSPDDFRGPLVGKVLNETAFLGVTGRVQFLNGDRVGSSTILQMQYGSMVKVGEYHALTDTLDLSVGDPIVWIDGHPPADRSIKIEELRRVSFPVYVGFVVMAALGITMAAFFLALNIRFRRHRYIKMSSPNMNNLIIVGSILCYISVILLGAEPGHKNRQLFSYWCTARSWTLALGFTLAFGAMFGKTWRVHAIFTNIKLNKKVIKDYKLMLIVLVLVLVDASILVTWQIVDPFDKAVKRMSPEVYEDFEIIPKIDYCSSQYMEIWLGALYAYKGLLLAFGCFLAWETRHVSIPALNDSQYIGMSVYNVVIMCVCGAAVSFIIKDRPTQSFVIIGLFIVFCTTITLCLVFLPKIIQLKRNPKGDESRVRATLRHSTKKTTKFEFAAQREKMRATSEENRQLRGFLEQKAVELDQVLDLLGEEASKRDVHLRSSLMHRKVVELKLSGDSPGKLSVRSCNPSEMECLSTYSEASAATSTLLMSEDWSPGPGLFKTRGRGSRAGAEAIELAGVRHLCKKQSVTIPPPAEEELSQDDPFGGVYLGPSDSPEEEKSVVPSSRDNMSPEHGGERQPLVANAMTFRVTPHIGGKGASSDLVLDNYCSPGAQGHAARRPPPRSLRLRRHSSPLAPIWTIAESCLEDHRNTVVAPDGGRAVTVRGGSVNRKFKPTHLGAGRSFVEEGSNYWEEDCEDTGNEVTKREDSREAVQAVRMKKFGGDNIWRESLLYRDFRIKRVLEKFPDEDCEERQPLMEPFLSPNQTKNDFCMTPPENQGLLVTPMTPQFQEPNVCTPMAPCYFKKHPCIYEGEGSGSDISIGVNEIPEPNGVTGASEGSESQADTGFATNKLSGIGGVTSSKPEANCAGTDDAFFSILEEATHAVTTTTTTTTTFFSASDKALPSTSASPLAVSPTPSSLQPSLSPERLSATPNPVDLASPIEAKLVSEASMACNIPGRVMPNNLTTPSHPARAQPDPPSPRSQSSPVTWHRQQQAPLNSKPKLQRSASEPAWSSATSPAPSPGGLVVLVPAPTSVAPSSSSNGPVAKARTRRKIRFECDVMENV